MASMSSDQGRRDDATERAKQAMLKVIADEAELTASCTGRAALDARVMTAIASVPRHEFVPAPEHSFAYCNEPLPIGYGQTISQPFIVALMTDLLDVKSGHVILEIGTGCGYQAAVLAQLARQVYSIEVVPELAEQAAKRLNRLGYSNVEVRQGDGALGWPERAPYDGIIVTAAAPDLPDALVAQLKPGGRMVIPVGGGFAQDLLVIEKSEDGRITRRNLLAVAFVPLVAGDK